ncbi:MAG: hypothetical protein ACXAD7_03600 [Candidatus Kariarchaeaceae archaeon]|jgi:hypothetical protein
MSYDFIAVIDVFGQFMLLGIILRWFLGFVPESLRKSFEEPALFLRSEITNTVESLWGNTKNFEVLFLSRIAAPFALMAFVHAYIFYDTRLQIYLDDYPFIKLIIFAVNVFIFINVVPSPEDIQQLWDTESHSKFAFMIKISLILSIYTTLDPTFTIAVLITPIYGSLMSNDVMQDTKWKSSNE